MKNNNILFQCSMCGSCCSNLDVFQGLYEDLDRGDGVCIHFDESNKSCSIYNDRPKKCRIEDGYELLCLTNQMSKEEYHKKTKLACNFLQSLAKK